MKRIILVLITVFSLSFTFGQVSESFTDIPTNTAGSYLTRTWTGDDMFGWEATNARTDQTITSKAITIRGNNGYLKNTGGSIAGGCGTLTFDYKRAFSGNSTMQVFINGTQIGSNITVSSTTSATFSSLVNVSGGIDIEIKNLTSGKRIAIDNLSWTAYSATNPTIIVGSTSMTGFGYEDGSVVSPVQYNTLEWANLTGNVSSLNTVNSFEFSIDSVNWFGASLLNVPIPPFPGFSPIARSVVVRLISGLSVGNYLDTVVLYSLGADTVRVFLEGEVTVPLPDIIINEINADPDATNGDANGDGIVSTTRDEFVELYNNEATAVDISGYTLSDANGVRHTFPSGSIINAGEYATVFGGGTPTGIPGSFSQTASTSSLSLNNGGDDVILKDASSTVIVSYSYTGAGSNRSIGRSPDLTGPFVQHNTIVVTGRLFSPGAANETVPSTCAISVITAGTQTACDVPTNTYSQEITVTYVDAPATGTLDVNGQSFAITTSPQTVTLVGLPSNGSSIDVTASFSDDIGCTATELALFNAAADCTPSCSQLFISEYGEPDGGNDKYLEIYNPTSSSVDLSNYQVWKISNGGSWSEDEETLSGTLAPGDVYVIANVAIAGNSNVDLVDAVVGVNGNDALGLAYNGGSGSVFTLIDAVGTDGTAPSTGWAVAGTNNATKDHVLVRKSSVQNPNTNWTSSAGTNTTDSEWELTAYIGGMNLPNLGAHTSDCIDYVWTGATDTDWNTASNWSSNLVPNASSVVAIPDVSLVSGNFPVITPSVTLGDITVDAGASLTVATGIVLDGLFSNNGTVTLQNGAYLDEFTNSGASFLGEITVETIAANGFSNDQRFISSPVNTPMFSEIADDLNGPWGAGAQGIDGLAITVADCNAPTLTAASNYGNVFEYNETLVLPMQCALDGWVVRSSGALENARGYSAYLTNGSTFDFTGTPNTGAIQISATNSTSGVTAAEGWNLLGNPYPSPIDRDLLVAGTGVTDIQYFVTAGVYTGSYQQYNPGDNIAIGQGFQAKVLATGNVNFENSMRTTGAATWYENENWFEHKLEVSVFGTDYADKTTLFYNNDATANYEPMYDVRKRKSNTGQPTLSTFGANLDLTLNGQSVNDLGETIPMNLDAGANGSFTLSFTGRETFPANTTIYVNDKQENVVHNIANGDYTFTATTNDNKERFELIFIPEVTIAITDEDCEGNTGTVQILNTDFINNRTFEIVSNNNIIATNDLVNLNESLIAGTYVVNVNDQYGGTQVYPIVVEAAEVVEAAFTLSSNELFVGEMLLLNNETTNSNTIDWNLDNSAITNVNNATYTFEEAGIYEVIMNVSNDECSDTKTETVTVLNKTTGIETVNGETISFYPNPTQDVLFVNTSVDVTISIVDVLGKTIITTTENSIDLSNVTTGLYIIQVYNANNKLIGTEKLIKK